MAVKKELSYRQRQALETRERIARAARRLFGTLGYHASTIEAVAKAAGVAVPTVYAAFGNKTSILAEIRLLWLRDSQVAELGAEALATADVAHRLELAARWTRNQVERGYDVITIYEEAARADPAMAKVWASVLNQRDAAIMRLAESLATSLKPELNPRTAADLIWALERPEVYRELVITRGWSVDRYESWLAETLKQQLIDPSKTAVRGKTTGRVRSSETRRKADLSNVRRAPATKS